MAKEDLKRLMKMEHEIYKIADEELNLEYCPIDFDMISDQKMLEIMSYNIPTNISNWKRGRDYERQRTLHDLGGMNMPYEVVINSDPARAYLMKSNPLAIQFLVMAHVVGHCAFFTMNKFFQKTRRDIIDVMYEAGKRFNKYETLYGIDEVEKIVDAGHALQLHSSPFASEETENDKRKRIFEERKRQIHSTNKTQFHNILTTKTEINEDIHLFNQKLWRDLKLKTPVEPTEDILRYVIDNSPILEDWQVDILELLRMEGQYYWPMMKTKFLNEGFATYTHQFIMNRLFEKKLLDVHEYSQFVYSNSLVKAHNPMSLNPYLIGSTMFEDIKYRWDTGRHGEAYNECNNYEEKQNWDNKSMKGHEKIMQIVRSHTDWFYMREYLTEDLVKELKLYIYFEKKGIQHDDYVITKQDSTTVKNLIANSFAHAVVPKIEIVNGDYNNKGNLLLNHLYTSHSLDKVFTEKTLEHIYDLWGSPVHLTSKTETRGKQQDIEYTFDPSCKLESTKDDQKEILSNMNKC